MIFTLMKLAFEVCCRAYTTYKIHGVSWRLLTIFWGELFALIVVPISAMKALVVAAITDHKPSRQDVDLEEVDALT